MAYWFLSDLEANREPRLGPDAAESSMRGQVRSSPAETVRALPLGVWRTRPSRAEPNHGAERPLLARRGGRRAAVMVRAMVRKLATSSCCGVGAAHACGRWLHFSALERQA
jgi:hypothetical protein